MFKISNSRSEAQSPLEYYIITANEAITLGEAVVLTTGALTACAATAVPEFIAMKSAVSAATGVIIPVVRVDENMVFETTFSADGSSIVQGDSVTLESTALTVTATTGSGVFMVVKKLGSGESGTYVLGKFRQ